MKDLAGDGASCFQRDVLGVDGSVYLAHDACGAGADGPLDDSSLGDHDAGASDVAADRAAEHKVSRVGDAAFENRLARYLERRQGRASAHSRSHTHY